MATSSSKQQTCVRVGVGVIVKDPSIVGNFYCGIRKGSHGVGTLALPGGHLEMMETWEECARREVKEEMDLDIDDIQFAHVTNDIMHHEEKHYVTLFMMARIVGETTIPKNMEPHKCEGWESYSWEDIRTKKDMLFGPLRQLLLDEPLHVLAFLESS